MKRILPGQVVSLGMKCGVEFKTRVDICESMRHRAGHVLKQVGAGKRVLLVGQSSIPSMWLDQTRQAIAEAGFEVTSYLLPDGEDCKSANELLELWRKLQSLSFERNDTVFVIGGGAAGDVAGFAAATYLRGVRTVLLPTTLLAQVDAAIGGKTGINLDAGKNLAGIVRLPEVVLIDNDVLATLPESQIRSGSGEIAKYAFIEKTIGAETEYRPGPSLLIDVLETTCNSGLQIDDPAVPFIVMSCVRMKLAVVAVDLHEQRLRRCLNLGHTLAHAIERVSCYAISHGEAVSIGIAFAFAVARGMERIADSEVERALRVLGAMKLPTALPPGLALDELMATMMQDKKRADGNIKFVLPYETIGLVDVDVLLNGDLLRSALEKFAACG